MNVQRRLKICSFVLLATLLVATSVFSQAPKPSVPAGNPLRMGGSLPLTGIYSETAKWIKEGYEFWAEDVNKRGGLLGRPVKLTIYDDESTAEKAVTYFERAITVDKVDLVFGGYPATSNVALMPMMEKYNRVFVGMGGQLPSFEQGYTYSFASPPLISDWTYIAFAGVYEELVPKAEWPKSVAILSMNNVIGLSTKPSLVKWLEKNNIKIVTEETYNLPLSDATPLVSKAKGRGAEVLICLSMFDDGVMLARAAKAMNYNPKMIWQLLASTIPAWMKEMGPDGNSVIAEMWWNARLPFAYNGLINAGAKAKFNLPAAPTYFGLGFSWMKTLELAVAGAGTLDSTKIRDYLRANKFDLPYGKGITFDKRGLPPPFAFAVQTTNGQVEPIWPKSVATAKLVYPRPAWSK
ncbi:MAG TPA: amino acid ABC transporter substrate-binding protein [Syntrophorhabdales bacterium]|nr:amino acid ABC transporter substrate-binding protein [Syntrophorhabdales bacterium]